MENLVVIIVGLPKSGKTSVANIILGGDQFKSYSKQRYKMLSREGVIVYDTGHRLQRNEYKEIQKEVQGLARVVILVTAQAGDPGDVVGYLEKLTGSQDFQKNMYLVFYSKDDKSFKQNERITKLMSKFPEAYMNIIGNLGKEEMKKQRLRLLDLLKGKDENGQAAEDIQIEASGTVATNFTTKDEANASGKATGNTGAVANDGDTEDEVEEMDTDDEVAWGKDRSEKKKSPLYITLIGSPGSGKSSTGNMLLGEAAFETDLYNDKETVKECREVQLKDKKKEVYVIDTPGELDSSSKKTYIDRISKNKSARHALLMTMNVSTRMSPAEKDRLSTLKATFGEKHLKKHLYVIFTHGDQFHILLRQGRVESFEKFIRSHKGQLGDLLKLCDYRCVLVNNCEQSEEKEKETVDEIYSMICKY